MKKRIVSLIFVLLLVFSFAVFAVSAMDYEEAQSSDTDKDAQMFDTAEDTSVNNAQPGQLVVDGANILTNDQVFSLTELCEKLGEKNKCDFVFVTVNSLNGKSETAYADDYYDYNGYSKDGVLFLIAMEDRKWHITTTGKCINKLNDSEQAAVMEEAQPMLSSGDYYNAFVKIAQKMSYYMLPHVSLIWIPLSLVIGFVIALLIMFAFKAQLKTVALQRGAASYVKQNSLNVTARRDNFLYSTISRVAKPKESSSTHTGSSGTSHGGSSGSF